MRTNIGIDDALMAAAQEATKLPTKRAVVEEGLRTLVRLREQQGIRALRGRIGFVGEPMEEDGAEQAVRGSLLNIKGRARRAEGGAASGGEGDRRRR